MKLKDSELHVAAMNSSKTVRPQRFSCKCSSPSITPSLHCTCSESLQVDKMAGVPLAMDQYPMLFSCNRIPEREVDSQRRTPPEQSLHAILAHNGHVSSCTGHLGTLGERGGEGKCA